MVRRQSNPRPNPQDLLNAWVEAVPAERSWRAILAASIHIDPGSNTLRVNGSVHLNNTTITQLPDNLHIEGSLYLNASQIQALPDNLYVGRELHARNTAISELPENIHVGRSLDLSYSNIKCFPTHGHFGGDLYLYHTKALEELPEDLEVQGSIDLEYSAIEALPRGLHVKCDLSASYTHIRHIPDDMEIDGNLYLEGTELETIPSTLRLKGGLDLAHSRIVHLPEGLHIDGDLTLNNSSIKELPESLRVHGDLALRNTPLQALPDDLHVGGDIDLERSAITRLPNNFHALGDLDLANTPIEALPDKLFVDGNLNLSFTRLKSVPKDLYVSGSLNLRDSTVRELPQTLHVRGLTDLGEKISHLPSGFFTDGSLKLTHSKVTTLPAGAHIGGDLDITQTRIAQLPNDLRVGGKILGLRAEMWLQSLHRSLTDSECLKTMQRSTSLDALEISAGGRTRSGWVALAQESLRKGNYVKARLWPGALSRALRQAEHRTTTFLPIASLEDPQLGLQDFALVELLGRSALFRHTTTGTFRVLKINKRGHAATELAKQFHTEMSLAAHQERLESTAPTPVGLFRIRGLETSLRHAATDLPQTQKTFFDTLAAFDVEGAAAVYVYDIADEGYFRYLHEPQLSDAEFEAGLRRATVDLFTALREGIVYTELADMFHNNETGHQDRADGGRFLPLVDIMRNMGYWGGTGRNTDWRAAVRYANIRKTGLADRGKYAWLSDIFARDHPLSTEAFGEVWGMTNPQARILANLMADYLYVLELICASRAKNLLAQSTLEGIARKAFEDEAWKLAAIQLTEATAQAIAAYCHVDDEDAALKTLLSVDIWQLQAQMKHWYGRNYLSEDGRGLAPLPKDLYDPKAVVLTKTLGRGFRIGWGMALDGPGTEDTGPVNGPHLITAGDRLRYLASLLMLLDGT